MKKFFIIPGFMQSAKDKQFDWLRKTLENKGFSVVLVPISWKYHTMTQYIAEFKGLYEKNKSTKNYILGFSYGAVIAFATASELKPDKIYLCSLSPDFAEERMRMKKSLRKLIGARRYQDGKKRSAIEIARKINIPTVILYGEKEGYKFPDLKLRAEQTSKLIKKSRLIVVKNAPHKIDHPEYITALRSALK